MLSPILAKLVDSKTGVKAGSGKDLDLVTVDTDVEVELAKEFQVLWPSSPSKTSTYYFHSTRCTLRVRRALVQITSLPTVIAFQDGKPVSQFMGAIPEDSVKNFLNSV